MTRINITDYPVVGPDDIREGDQFLRASDTTHGAYYLATAVRVTDQRIFTDLPERGIFLKSNGSEWRLVHRAPMAEPTYLGAVVILTGGRKAVRVAEGITTALAWFQPDTARSRSWSSICDQVVRVES